MRRSGLVLALMCGAATCVVADDLAGAWVTPDVVRSLERAQARRRAARDREWREALRETAGDRGTIAALAVPQPAARPRPDRRAALAHLAWLAEDPGPPLEEGRGVPVATHAPVPKRIGPPASSTPAPAHRAVRQFQRMRAIREHAEPHPLGTQEAHEFLAAMAEQPVAPPPPPRTRPILARAAAVVPRRVAAPAAVPAPPVKRPAPPPPAFVAESQKAAQRSLGAPRKKSPVSRQSLFGWRDRDSRTAGRHVLRDSED